MPKRLIVTGASGFVAGSVICQAGPEWEVHAVSTRPPPIQRDGLHWHRFSGLSELLAPGTLGRLFDDTQPDVVIHAAAVADIDFCETHPAETDQINIHYTVALADLCRERNVRIVLTSTDTVFDGTKGDYVETDPPGPVNHYGHTKLQAEQAVTARLQDFCIARLAIVMGLPFFGGGNSFLRRLITVLDSGREVPVPVEEIRTPSDVVTLGQALLELAGNTYEGIIHLAGNDRMDRLVFSRLIAQRLGYPPEQIVPAAPTGIPGRARRPLDVSLNNAKARATLKTPMLGLLEGLELVLSTKRASDEA